MALFSDRIREIRKDLGMNKVQFAKYINTVPSNITRYEKKDMNISMSAIEEMSLRLQISPSWLMGWSDDKYGIDKVEYIKIPLIDSIKSNVPLLSSSNITGHEIVSKRFYADFCVPIMSSQPSDEEIENPDLAFLIYDIEVVDRDLVGIVVESHILIRRLYKLHEYSLFQKDGENEFEDYGAVNIIGKVVYIIKRIR